MASSRPSRVTRSSVGINGLDENFCGRTLRNRSIAQPDDSSPPPTPRARSPKKPGGQTQGEGGAGSRKRGLSCSEKEEPAENCERLRPGASEVSPALKRAKRCSRPTDVLPGAEGEATPPPGAAKPDSLAPGPSSPPHPLRLLPLPPPPLVGKDTAAEEPEEKRTDGALEEIPPPPSLHAHKATNGVAEDPSALDSSFLTATPTHPLLNGGQTLPAPCPAPTVPCVSPVHESTDPPPGPGPQGDCSNGLVAEGGAAGTDGDLVEVDSVSEEVVVLEEVVEMEARAADETPDDANKAEGGVGANISGDAVVDDLVSTFASVPAPEPPTFVELHEHRYALRTSPRRANCRPASPDTATPTPLPLQQPVECIKQEEVFSDDIGDSTDLANELPEHVGSKVVIDSQACRSTKDSTADEEEEEDEEDPDVYYFESDHLALKHNKDYQRLLQTISVLEAQRTRAIMDLEALARHQREALVDPIAFVEQLQQQVELSLPCPQRVVQLPEIAWDQYTSGMGDFERDFCDKTRKTRQLKLIYDKVGLPVRPKSPLDSKKESESGSLYSSLPSSDTPEHNSSSRTQMIRGRMCHPNKSDTFNQLWTVEEQKKLEQLLMKYPPEEVESRRWQKIADELGNRTAKQVASRVQKYFIKLTKAGIPVPGRTPNLYLYNRKASSKRQHHLNKHLYRPSTFMTSYEPPVYMDDEDERSGFFSSMQDTMADDSDEDSVPVEWRHLPEYKELLELKRLRKMKLQELHTEGEVIQHMGYKCDACGTEPIQGVRWHCQDCPPDSAVDFCTNCSDCLFKTETHKPTHRLEPVYQAESFLDRDYCLPQSTGYNYLDPNYFPANR
uniref:ZZ-type zinc finger-containing protein 3 n=1 Tax=Denticeps clupeoides TaxID=299321 RepID=A0AAY4DP59_9TELE